jgi:hypothetical protein
MTTLYIATHNITGLKYFGMTKRFFTENDLQNNYLGSGVYWKKHLNKYGKDVTMKIFDICLDIDVEEVALNFSIQHKIVESDEWANLCLENGADGNPGRIVSDETKMKFKDTLNKEFYIDGEITNIAKIRGKKAANTMKKKIVYYNSEEMSLSKKAALKASETMRDTKINDKNALEIKAEKSAETRKNKMCIFEGVEMTIQERANIKLSRTVKTEINGVSLASIKNIKSANTVALSNPFYNIFHIDKGLLETNIPKKDLRKISQVLINTNKTNYLGKSERSKAQLIKNNKTNLIGLYVERIISDKK